MTDNEQIDAMMYEAEMEQRREERKMNKIKRFEENDSDQKVVSYQITDSITVERIVCRATSQWQSFTNLVVDGEVVRQYGGIGGFGTKKATAWALSREGFDLAMARAKRMAQEAV